MGRSTAGIIPYVQTISIHPLRGEWDGSETKITLNDAISIHPLRGEWDKEIAKRTKKAAISIHPLRGEWDLFAFWSSQTMPFQSTHSVGSGTCYCKRV